MNLSAELATYRTYEQVTTKLKELDAKHEANTLVGDERHLYNNLLIMAEDKGYISVHSRTDKITYLKD